MAKFNLLLPILFSVFFISCNRNNSGIKNSEEVNSDANVLLDNSDPSNITESEPFKNQPNEFCTIIRKLEVEYYAPQLKMDENTAYPKKYCLLDVCLEKINNDGLVINVGDSSATAHATYALIKVFENDTETKEYANKYAIKDVVYEE